MNRGMISGRTGLRVGSGAHLRPAIFTLACTQGVPECSARNLKEPRLGPLRRAQAVEVLDDSEEHILKQIVGLNARRHAASQAGS